MDDKLYTQIIERLAKIEVKIDDIKRFQKKVDEHDIQLVQLIEKDANQQKLIEELIQKDKDKGKWLFGIVASIVAGVIVATIRFFVGI